MKVIRSVLWSLLKALFHPVVLISLFAPLILSLNLIALRDMLGFPYGVAEVSGEYAGLKEALSNIWAYALIDFNVQLYTLMLAWIIFYVEVLGIGIKLTQRHTVPRVTNVIKSSTISLIFAICIVVLFFIGLAVFLSGALSGPNTVSLYLPNGLHISGGIRVPPFESSITWFRGLIVLCGFTLSWWEQSVLPRIMELPSE